MNIGSVFLSVSQLAPARILLCLFATSGLVSIEPEVEPIDEYFLTAIGGGAERRYRREWLATLNQTFHRPFRLRSSQRIVLHSSVTALDTRAPHGLRIALPLSLRKSAIVLKSGDNRPVSQISSTLRWVSRSSRRLDWIRFK